MKAPKLPVITDYVTPGKNAIFSNEQSKGTRLVPNIVFSYSTAKNPIADKVPVLPYMLGRMREIQKGFGITNRNETCIKTNYSETVLEELKVLGEKHGITNFGFCQVKPDMVFQDRFVQYQNAIVVIMPMNPKVIQTAPSKASMKEVFRTYYGLGRFVNQAAKLLQRHGYGVQPGPALGGDVNYGLLAREAGLGEIGKHGLLITEEEGCSLRIAGVFTSMELPSERENAHGWIRDFCEGCNLCVRACPGEAIFLETAIDDCGRRQHIDWRKCAVPFSNQYGCTVCVKACTFFKGDYQRIKKGFERSVKRPE